MVVSRRGAITRADVEADTTSMLPIWLLLRPFLEEWVTEHPALEIWQRELVRGVMAYEEHRLRFVNGADVTTDEGIAALGDNWSAFLSNVDIAAVFDAMQTDQPVTPTLVEESAVVLVRHELDSFRAYTTDVAHIADLANHPFLLEASVG
jgi:hypothetical protein